MKKLLIAGAGGLGREVYQNIVDIEDSRSEWDFIGFLTDHPSDLDKYNMSHRIVGTIIDYYPAQGEYIVCAIGDPIARTRICRDLEKRGAEFTSIIHPQTLISKCCSIGKGVIVMPGAQISVNARVSNFAVINSLTIVGHDAIIGEGCVISDQCDINGNVQLEDEVFMGSGARILPRIHVHRRATVGAGSVVIRDVKEGTSVFGNPAKAIYNPKIE